MVTKPSFKSVLGRACLCCTLALVLTGCTADKLWRPQEVSSIQDAGAVHLAVLSVAPFDKYSESVQPQFELKPKEALDQVLPSTIAFDQRILDLLGLKMKAALPTVISTETTATKEQTGSQPSVSREQTTTSKSGDVSALTAETPTAGGRTAASLPGGGSTLGTTLGQDPFLKFWTAAALYQEVQLLNRYVQDAAIPDGFKPFVVRLQVSLLPWARRQPYDAYADISFFGGDFSFGRILTGKEVNQKQGAESDLRANRIEPFKETKPSDRETSKKEVRVLPLLVTDDIEAALEARSYDRVRQLAFALSAAINGIGLQSNIEKMNEQLESVAGRDYNSAFTVARASHNTLRVRFGAMNQASAQYSMIPQTHNVTLLLMVPKEMSQQKELHQRMVRLVLRTAFVDARDGTELKHDANVRQKQILKVLENHKIIIETMSENDKTDYIYEIIRHLAENDYEGFRGHVGSIRYPEALWVDLASLRELSRYQSATLTLPNYEPELAPENNKQKLLLIDDGRSSISTTLVGIRNIIPRKIRVILRTETVSLVDKGSAQSTPQKNADPVIDLVANSISPGLADDEFLVTFPSLAAIKRKPVNNIVKVVVSVREEPRLGEKTYEGFFVVKPD